MTDNRDRQAVRRRGPDRRHHEPAAEPRRRPTAINLWQTIGPFAVFVVLFAIVAILRPAFVGGGGLGILATQADGDPAGRPWARRWCCTSAPSTCPTRRSRSSRRSCWP